MNKIINKLFLATALVALVLTSCTDEADVLDNKPIKNKKTVEESLRPYPEFEEISINAEDVISLLLDFNKAMNGEIEMSDMQIDTALLLMETYFNYGVVDKQSNYDLSSTYEETSFEFTLNLINENQLTGLELQDGFTEFLNNVKSDMSGKYLKFSDLYVSEYDGASITFKLIIPPYTQEEYEMWPSGVSVVRVMMQSHDEIYVPDYLTIDWKNTLGNQFYAYDKVLANLFLTYRAGLYYSIRSSMPTNQFIYSKIIDSNGDIILTADILRNEVLPNGIDVANQIQLPQDNAIVGVDVELEKLILTGLKSPIYGASAYFVGYEYCNVDFGHHFANSIATIEFNL